MNELIIAEKIEKRLREKREPPVFPLTPTHRKELRKLRDTNIGNLRNRLITIRQLKQEEYTKKYAKDIEKELAKHEKTVEMLNKDWEERVRNIKLILAERKELEKNVDTSKLNLDNDWNDISQLNFNGVDFNRRYYLDKENKIIEIAEEEFEKKYGEKFKAIEKKIDELVTFYEEAINFGDLELVKQLYYTMKGADKFFEKISKLKI